MTATGIDPAALDLARHFLADHEVAEPRSDQQIADDLLSLAETIQSTVEDWFSLNSMGARS